MNSEQKLVDICFAIAFSANSMQRKSNEEIARWVAEQLRECGFDTTPVSSSWGVLKGLK